MSYHTQWLLTYDDAFVSRGRSCETQQANTFKDDTRGDMAALARAILRGEPEPLNTFQIMVPGAPGFADKVEGPGDTIDSSAITDEELLAAVQAIWPTVASLYYTSDGTPLDQAT